MPWNKRTLALPASPPSVRLAREWVTDVLREIGRDDLTEAARLAVSELVTNAILHAEPPMTVHVRGTVEQPRVEVTDQSLVPPQPRDQRPAELDGEAVLATMGRGLELVASYAARWGADVSPSGTGKVVWFQPSSTIQEPPTCGELFDMEAAVARLGLPPTDPDKLVEIRLLGMPAELFAHLRRHFDELGRETRLLALGAPLRYPLAQEFADTYVQVEAQRRQVTGVSDLDRAIAEGRETVDLTYLVPPTTPATMARLARLISRVYAELSGRVLLSVRPPDLLIGLEEWYLGEFSRQAAGQEPSPWSGSTRLDLTARHEVR